MSTATELAEELRDPLGAAQRRLERIARLIADAPPNVLAEAKAELDYAIADVAIGAQRVADVLELLDPEGLDLPAGSPEAKLAGAVRRRLAGVEEL